MDSTTPKKSTFAGRMHPAVANGLLSPITPKSRDAESPRKSLDSLCGEILALTHNLEQQCAAIKIGVNDLNTQAIAAQVRLTAERFKHVGEQEEKNKTIEILMHEITQLRVVNNDLQRKATSNHKKYLLEREAKDNALQDLKDVNQLWEKVSQDLIESKDINEKLKSDLQQAQQAAREKVLEVETTAQTAMQAQTRRINELEAQFNEQDRLLKKHTTDYERYKCSIKKANFCVSVYETAMRAAFQSFDPVKEQPYFQRILQLVYEAKTKRLSTHASKFGSNENATGAQGSNKEHTTQSLEGDHDPVSSDDDEPILAKLRRKRHTEAYEVGLMKKRVCLDVYGNEQDKGDRDECDTTVDDHLGILAEEDDEEMEDAQSDDISDEEWLPGSE